jgi:hypothetical protein
MEALEQRADDLPKRVRTYDRSLRAIRTDEWKLIRGSDGSTELYQVVSDSVESENVAGQNPDVVETLSEELDKCLDSFEHAQSDAPVELSPETKSRLEELGYLQ